MKAVRLLLVLAAALPCAGFAAGEPTAPAAAANGVFRLTVQPPRFAARYGATDAPPGRQFLVLATRWDCRIDPALAAARGLATSYTVPELAQHLYVVLDAQHGGVPRPGLDDGTGRASLAQLTLAKPGAMQSGDVVFEVPAGKFTSVDLRFYDDTAGHLRLALAGPAPAVAPVQPPQRNAVAEVGVFGFERPAAGVAAPAGFVAVAVDLRARSVWTNRGEAPGFDAAVAPGTPVGRVNLLDWSELPKQLHVLADGEYAYPVAEASPLPATGRFIPEFFLGGRVVFLVPAAARSLELHCGQPHAATDGGVIDLPPLRFPLVVATAPVAATTSGAVLRIRDDPLAVEIRARRAGAFAGESAAAGTTFLVLDVAVANGGDHGEFFQPRDQLFLVDAAGVETPLDEITARGPRRPEDPLPVPKGERRRCEVVFRVPAAARGATLSFHGAEFRQTYDLP